MAMQASATVEDLYHVPENAKAELVNGEVVVMSPTGDTPSRAASNIYLSLRQHERAAGGMGRAYADNTGFTVALPHRQSFSPDAAWYVGPRTGGKFLQGAPVFAVEVRSEGDYGRDAEQAIAAKRADYFAAGTVVVWDVDVLREGVVRVYRASDPKRPRVYRRGEQAEAEPAVPSWRFPVTELFDYD